MRPEDCKEGGRKAVAVNITLPPVLHERLFEIVERQGFSGPSDYFQSRIRLDSGLGLKVYEEQKGN
jgi:hypothetical protein